jgi:hypothetical protein
MVLIGISDILPQKEKKLKFTPAVEKGQNYTNDSQWRRSEKSTIADGRCKASKEELRRPHSPIPKAA